MHCSISRNRPQTSVKKLTTFTRAMAASGYINYNLLPSPLNSPALYPLPPPVPDLAAYNILMSSKRGRKRNDNLPPNRARDVQRAFRARRAAHLQVRIHALFFPILFIKSLQTMLIHTSRLSRIASRSSKRRTTTCVLPSISHRQTDILLGAVPPARINQSRSSAQVVLVRSPLEARVPRLRGQAPPLRTKMPPN